MVYMYERDYDLVDLLIPQRSRYEVTVNDGSSGNSGDEYGIAVNEKAVYDDPENRNLIYKKAAVVEDSSPNSDTSNTIASNLASELESVYDEITASASGSVVTIQTEEEWKHLDLRVESFTTDENGNITEKLAEPEAYEIQNAPNWDKSFSTMETVPREGLVSDSADQLVPSGSESSELRKYTRFRFDPVDYSEANDDEIQFYKIAPVVDGSTQTSGPIVMVLSRDHLYETHPAVTLNGDPPTASSVDGALELNFAYQTTSIKIKNRGSNPVYLSFGSSDGEWELPANGGEFSDNRISTWDIRLRTADSAMAASNVDIYATINTEKGI